MATSELFSIDNFTIHVKENQLQTIWKPVIVERM